MLAAVGLWLAGVGDVVAQALPAASSPATTATPDARPVAGRVDFVDGAPQVTASGQTPRRMAVGDTVYQGDRIITDAAAEVHVKLADGGFIAVRPASELLVQRFKAEGGKDDISFFNLVVGSFRSITGWVAKNNPSRYRITTSTATIGVRGTDHEPYVIAEGSNLGEPGTYDKVNAGSSYVEGLDSSGQRRRIAIAAGQAGFFAHDRLQAPRVLDRVPTLFRATRNEARLDGLHERTRQQLGPLREQRRQQIIERRRSPATATSAPGAAPVKQRQARTEQQQQQQRRQARAQPQVDVQQQRRDARLQAREERQKTRAGGQPTAPKQERQRRRGENSNR